MSDKRGINDDSWDMKDLDMAVWRLLLEDPGALMFRELRALKAMFDVMENDHGDLCDCYQCEIFKKKRTKKIIIDFNS